MNRKGLSIDSNDDWNTNLCFTLDLNKNDIWVTISDDVNESANFDLSYSDLEDIKRFCEEALASRRNK